MVANGRRRSPVSPSHFASSAATATAVTVPSLSLAPTYGQMGVPAYVKAALCSAHPRSAICQCQGASAVSMATPPASRGASVSECKRVRASGAGNPQFRATSTPADRTQPPGLLPPLLPLLLSTTFSAAAVAILRRHPLDHPLPPTTRDRLGPRYLSQARMRSYNFRNS